MSFLKKLAPVLDWLPYISIVALFVISTLLRADNAKLTGQLNAKESENALLASYVNVQATALDQKDAVIKQQSASVDALATAAQANRSVYNAALQTAAVNARVQKEAAGQLMALTAPEGELAQCRAARDLLEKELVE